jgi:N-acetyl-gamma-glutamyl-phosphate reductase
LEVAVVGAAGYAGVEAVRWVLSHPRLSLAHVTSAADAGRPLADLYPSLGHATDLVFEAPDADAIARAARIALLAVPHTAALSLVPQLLDRGVTVVDMSADYRLTDAAVYEHWYGVAHTSPELLNEAVYGLPEFARDRLPGASLVACPGCYPTATALAAMPALEAGVAASHRIVVDAKSGVSGAGRGLMPATHYCSADESVTAYKVAAHRHTPEMEQLLSGSAGEQVSVLFAPHLVPMNRGLLATVYIEVAKDFTAADALAIYKNRYVTEPFVTVHDAGVMPSTAEVRGTNRASVGVTVDERTGTLIAVCAIDNLGKGAAGQAVQCLNAVLGFPETEGLDAPGPVV